MLRKVLTGCLAQRILPLCLAGMQTTWKVDEGLAASLERAIRADANDFNSRNRLRLLRVCRVLCPPDGAADAAIILQCLLTVDPILYELLGGGSLPGRATLAALCNWDRNPIVCAQERIVEKLVAWGEEGPVWAAVTAAGARFDDHRCALLAKRELLALAAGR